VIFNQTTNNLKLFIMKTPQKIALIVLGILFLISMTSCAVYVKHDNGKHKGWYKNAGNPHNAMSSKQSGKSKAHTKY
jgi:hypothetical protein